MSSTFNTFIQLSNNNLDEPNFGYPDNGKKRNNAEYNFDFNFFNNKVTNANRDNIVGYDVFNLTRRSFVNKSVADNPVGFIKIEAVTQDDSSIVANTLNKRLQGNSINNKPSIVYRQILTLEANSSYIFSFNAFVQRRFNNTFPAVRIKLYDYNSPTYSSDIQTGFALLAQSDPVISRNSIFINTGKYYSDYTQLSQSSNNGADLGIVSFSLEYNEDNDIRTLYYNNDSIQKNVILAFEFDSGYKNNDAVYIRNFEMMENRGGDGFITPLNGPFSISIDSTLQLYDTGDGMGKKLGVLSIGTASNLNVIGTLNVSGTILLNGEEVLAGGGGGGGSGTNINTNSFTANLLIATTLLVKRKTTILGDLTASGTTTFNNINITSSLNVAGGLNVEFDMNTNYDVVASGGGVFYDTLKVYNVGEFASSLRAVGPFFATQDAFVSGTLTVNSNLQINNNVNINSVLTTRFATIESLTVSNSLRVNSNLSINGSLAIQTAQFTNTNTLITTDLTINSSLFVSRNLQVSNLTVLNTANLGNLTVNNLTATGNNINLNNRILLQPAGNTINNSTLFTSTVNILNNYFFSNSALIINSNLNILNDTTINRRLFLFGTGEFASSLNVNGLTYFDSSVSIRRNLFVSGNFVTEGFSANRTSYFNDTLFTNILISSNLTVNGTTNCTNLLASNLVRGTSGIIDSNLRVSRNLTVIGDILLSGRMIVNGKVIDFDNMGSGGGGGGGTDSLLFLTVNGDLNVMSNTFLLGTLEVSSGTNFLNDVTISRNLTVNSAVTLRGTTSINNNLTIASNLTVSGNMILRGSLNATDLTLNAGELAISDNIIEISKGNATDLKDTGILFNYNSNRFAGLIRKFQTPNFVLLQNYPFAGENIINYNNSNLASLILSDISSQSISNNNTISTNNLVASNLSVINSFNVSTVSTINLSVGNNTVIGGDLQVNNISTDGLTASSLILNSGLLVTANVDNLTVNSTFFVNVSSTFNSHLKVNGEIEAISLKVVSGLSLPSSLNLTGGLTVGAEFVGNTMLINSTANMYLINVSAINVYEKANISALEVQNFNVNNNFNASGSLIINSSLNVLGKSNFGILSATGTVSVDNTLTVSDNLLLNSGSIIYFGDSTTVGTWRLNPNNQSRVDAITSNSYKIYEMLLERLHLINGEKKWIRLYSFYGGGEDPAEIDDQGFNTITDLQTTGGTKIIRGYYMKNYGQSKYLFYVGTNPAYNFGKVVGINLPYTTNNAFNPAGVNRTVPKTLNTSINGVNINVNTDGFLVVGNDSSLAEPAEGEFNGMSVSGPIYFGRKSASNAVRIRRYNDAGSTAVAFEKLVSGVWQQYTKITKTAPGTYFEQAPNKSTPIQPNDFIVNGTTRKNLFVIQGCGGANGAVMINKNNLSNAGSVFEIYGELTLRRPIISFVDNYSSPTWEWTLQYESATGDFIVSKTGSGVSNRFTLAGTPSGAISTAPQNGSVDVTNDFIINTNNNSNVIDSATTILHVQNSSNNVGINTTNPETTLDINGYLRVEKYLFLGAFVPNTWFFEASASQLKLRYLDIHLIAQDGAGFGF